MKIRGAIPIFANIHKGYKFFTGTISRKEEDETFLNYSIGVRFAKNSFSNEFLNSIECDKATMINVEEGFISVERYEDKDDKPQRKLVLVILKATIMTDKQIEHNRDLNNNKEEIHNELKDADDLPF